MSATVFRNFIYVSQKSGRVLAIRRSREFDLSVTSSEFKCFAMTSGAPLFFKNAFSFSYSVISGFTPLSNDTSALDDRLVQKKIEILVGVKLNVEMVKQRLRENLNRRYVKSMDLDRGLEVRAEALIRRERILGLRRCQKLFAEFLKRIESATSLESVDLVYDHLRFNCNIGSYASIGERF